MNNNNAILKADQSEPHLSPDVALVIKYIDRVWNHKKLAELSDYLHEHYIDHSMPHSAVQNQEGLLLYLRQLARTVSHTTEIVGLTTLGELVICHVRIRVAALFTKGELCGCTEIIDGYRTFRMCNGKIAEHWEII